MKYLIRLGITGLALACILAILAMIATSSKSLENIMYEDLTCEELMHGYGFNKAVLSDIVAYYDGCVDYADSPASVGELDMLSCRFIREHATFVQGIVNDIASVYNIKCAVK